MHKSKCLDPHRHKPGYFPRSGSAVGTSGMRETRYVPNVYARDINCDPGGTRVWVRGSGQIGGQGGRPDFTEVMFHLTIGRKVLREFRIPLGHDLAGG